jgi:hypothetical protein
MSPLFAGRPPDLVRKCFGGKALRHFYVPFVGSTDAPANDYRGSAPLSSLVTLGS